MVLKEAFNPFLHLFAAVFKSLKGNYLEYSIFPFLIIRKVV